MAKAIGHEYIEDALRFVFPGDCLDEMLIKFNVFHRLFQFYFLI